jgi:nitrilase
VQTVKVACCQVEPVVLDREATLDKLGTVAAEAAAQGAELVVLPETFVPVYPSSVWAKALAGWAEPGAKEAFALLARESVAVPGPACDRLGEIAREHGIWLVTGVNEVDPERPGTIYNALLYHDPEGALALHHRKLVPTNHERLLWGAGRRSRAARDRDSAGAARRADLLGELHAAGAVLALRLRGRDLYRVDC